jgi:hypothetical protein
MLNEQYWGTPPTGKLLVCTNTGYQYSVAGENLARDLVIHRAWFLHGWRLHTSSKHFAKEICETGIAVVDGKLGGVETTLVVQMFGTPSVLSGSIIDHDHRLLAHKNSSNKLQPHFNKCWQKHNTSRAFFTNRSHKSLLAAMVLLLLLCYFMIQSCA